METKQLEKNPIKRAFINGALISSLFTSAFVLILILSESENKFTYAISIFIGGIVIETFTIFKGIFFVRCPVCNEKMENHGKWIGFIKHVVGYECRMCHISWEVPGMKLDKKIEFDDEAEI